MALLKHLAAIMASVLLTCAATSAQTITGTISDEHGHPLPGANVSLAETVLGAATNASGQYSIARVPAGEHTIRVSMIGFERFESSITVAESGAVLDAVLRETHVNMSEVVVTGSRREQLYSEAPVKINVLDDKLFKAVQSASLVEGLSYQPGLRTENNCQNCGFTQVRINGLEGPYSQVLIDSRPLFGSLVGVYGLEQVPSVMIDRVEIVRGGGSTLYGSNAVAGTINVITKEPTANSFNFTTSNAFIDGRIPDRSSQLSTSIVNDNHNLGMYLFGLYRERTPYDHDGDGYSEITKLQNASLGMKAYYSPSHTGRLTLDVQHLSESRRGGNRFDFPEHEADIAESVEHDITNIGITYEQYLNSEDDRISLYTSGSNVERASYYGAGRDPNAYGNTRNRLFVAGGQFSHAGDEYFGGESITTVGIEWKQDHLEDETPGYDRYIDQRVNQLGVYLQQELKFGSLVSVNLGLRGEDHSALDGIVFDPRANLLVNPLEDMQVRLTYSTGSRPPVTFDEDLHIEAVGGNVQIITSAADLRPETSESFSGAVDYDLRIGSLPITVTFDGFHTELRDAFVLEETASDADGNMRLERRNGGGAHVSGGGFEVKVSPSSDAQIQFGMTFQESRLEEAAEWAEGMYSEQLLRTPGSYGYVSSYFWFGERLNMSVSAVYTGSMTVPHYAGYIAEDRLERTEAFFDATIRAGYVLLEKPYLEVFAGMYNVLNQYQTDFDRGADRDAGYVYGPMRPRTIFGGLTVRM
ncbi:MAG: TonB-dependent receptor [Ectothiorhodospiraceae bacterium]|nr:TonB-dependent receptor [Ectothiorhodospiraceae bacterium]